MADAKLSPKQLKEVLKIVTNAESRTHDIIIITAVMIGFIVLSVAVYIAQTVVTSLQEKKKSRKKNTTLVISIDEEKTSKKEKKSKKKKKNKREEEIEECSHGPITHEPSKSIHFLVDLLAPLPSKSEEPKSQRPQSASQECSRPETSPDPVTTPVLPTPSPVPTSIKGIRKTDCSSPADQKKKKVSWLDEKTAIELQT